MLVLCLYYACIMLVLHARCARCARPPLFFYFLCSLRERSQLYISRNEWDIDLSTTLLLFYNLSYLHVYFINILQSFITGLLKIHNILTLHTCIMRSLRSPPIPSTFFLFFCIPGDYTYPEMSGILIYQIHYYFFITYLIYTFFY